MIAEDLLWRNIVSSKNEGSNYYKVDVDGYGEMDCPKGSVHRGFCMQSWIHPSAYHELTWKELYMELDYPYANLLVSDGHNCKVCPERKNCRAGFKDDPEQEQCSGWKEEYNKLKH